MGAQTRYTEYRETIANKATEKGMAEGMSVLVARCERGPTQISILLEANFANPVLGKVKKLVIRAGLPNLDVSKTICEITPNCGGIIPYK